MPKKGNLTPAASGTPSELLTHHPTHWVRRHVGFKVLACVPTCHDNGLP